MPVTSLVTDAGTIDSSGCDPYNCCPDVASTTETATCEPSPGRATSGPRAAATPDAVGAGAWPSAPTSTAGGGLGVLPGFHCAPVPETCVVRAGPPSTPPTAAAAAAVSATTLKINPA